MLDYIISRKTAILAYEKGFRVENSIDRMSMSYYPSQKEPKWWQFKKCLEYDKAPKYYAPTLQQMQYWIIQNSPFFPEQQMYVKNGKYKFKSIVKSMYENDLMIEYENLDYDHPLDALDNAIYEALKIFDKVELE